MKKSYQTDNYPWNKVAHIWFIGIVCLFSCIQVYSQAVPHLDVGSGKKILVVGDSLSAAYKLPSEKGWVHLMQQKLSETHPAYQVINASISGATTAAGFSVMKKSLALHQPDIVILELGANDGLQGKPVSYIQNNLDELISMAKQSGATVLLLGIRLPPNFGSRYTQPFFEQFGVLAKKHQLPLVPFLLEGVAGRPEFMMQDGLHPTADAQPLVLENVWPMLVTLL